MPGRSSEKQVQVNDRYKLERRRWNFLNSTFWRQPMAASESIVLSIMQPDRHTISLESMIENVLHQLAVRHSEGQPDSAQADDGIGLPRGIL